MLYLRGWYHAEGVATVDAGRLSAIEVVSEDFAQVKRCCGFFHILEGQSRCALYAFRGKLFLQVEQNRWDWSEDAVVIKHRRSWWARGRDSVSVYACGKRQFRALYEGFVAKSIRLGNMAFDDLDEETSDWWVWLSRVLASPETRNLLVAKWQAGI